MLDKVAQIAKTKGDVHEIDDVLNSQFFDRNKAESIIHKHNVTDEIIATINSPMNPDAKPFYMLTDDDIKVNLCIIRNYLVAKLAKEQNNG